MTAQTVQVVEVGLRDGLQNQPRVLAARDKLAVLSRLLSAGIRHLELGSFVRADLVPQMADTPELYAALDAGMRGKAEFIALVPNLRGARAAVQAGATSLRMVLSASEGHSRSNTGRSVAEGVAEAARLAEFAASVPGLTVAAAIATSFVCPFDGLVPPEQVVKIVGQLIAAGFSSISIADTLGRANPRQVTATIGYLSARYPALELNLHLHDTYGMGIANVIAGLDAGVRSFDASAAGIGGCPFAPGAAGNVATEDIVFVLHDLEFQTGIDLAGLETAVAELCSSLGREPASSISRTGVWSMS